MCILTTYAQLIQQILRLVFFKFFLYKTADLAKYIFKLLYNYDKLIYLLLWLKLANKMNPQYHFCFAFKKISFKQTTAKNLDNFSTYQFQILLNHDVIGCSSPIMCTPNQNCEIILQNINLMLRINKNQTKTKSNCEIRFIEADQAQQQKLVGCYQFELINYIKAYHQLNRNCIELSIQIGVDIIIYYEVYLEITRESLSRIINQHEAAKQNNILESNDQTDSFQSLEIQNSQSKAQIKELQYDLLSPVILRQRYWSPKRSKRQAQTPTTKNLKRSQLLSKQEDQLQQMNHLKMRKTQSSNTDFKSIKTKMKRSIASVIQQLQVKKEEQENDYNFIKLYQVIGNDSKVILPGKNDSYELYKSKTDRGLEIRQQKSMRICGSAEFQSKEQRKVKTYFYLLLLLIMLVMTASLFFFKDSRAHSKRFKQKRRPKVYN